MTGPITCCTAVPRKPDPGGLWTKPAEMRYNYSKENSSSTCRTAVVLWHKYPDCTACVLVSECLWCTHTYTYLPTLTSSFTLTSQRSQTQTRSHAQPLHNTRKPDSKSNLNHTRTHFCKCECPERQREDGKYGSKSKSEMNKNKSKLGKSTWTCHT